MSSISCVFKAAATVFLPLSFLHSSVAGQKYVWYGTIFGSEPKFLYAVTGWVAASHLAPVAVLASIVHL